MGAKVLDLKEARSIVEEAENNVTEAAPAAVDLVNVIAEREPLERVVAGLITKLAELERGTGRLEVELEESLKIGHWMADQLDASNAALAKSRAESAKLQSEVQALTRAIERASYSILSLPIRGKLRAALAAI